ncbi:protein S100-A13 isoform X2 [Canis lupus familiaris]|nr:protein S100-A13 isoform X2 [Canis lupus familiaris]XP_038528037.1 protein S100-A13 isoform X2 [Canis lupus familiaris]
MERVLMAAEPLTELEAAIETVVTTFFTFAGQEGRKGSLSIHEFRELVTQQLPHLLKEWTQRCFWESCRPSVLEGGQEKTVQTPHFTYLGFFFLRCTAPWKLMGHLPPFSYIP